MQWYYSRGGQRFGPLEEAAFFDLARTGGVLPGDLVWNASMGEEWSRADAVPALSALLAGAGAGSPPPPPPPPPGAPRDASPVSGLGHGGTPNADLMRMARESLRGNWGIAIGVSLLYGLIVGVAGGTFLGGILVAGPMVVGLSGFFLMLIRRRPTEVGQLFRGFDNFGTNLGAYVLVTLIVFAWSLLFLIPGIVASFSYAMTYYLLADHPEMTASQAMAMSKDMMRGRRGKLFFLELRFFGWALLCVLTGGIGYIWLLPYIHAATSFFYEDIRGTVQV